MSNLTLKEIQNSSFNDLYVKLISENDCSTSEYQLLLEFAIIFINSGDIQVQKLGYRIILRYSVKTSDYIPLYDVAFNKGYIPIVKYIEQMYANRNDGNSSFNSVFLSSFLEMFKLGNIYRTIDQIKLNKDFFEHNNDNMVVIAPTSYGKSELIINLINTNKSENICIIVPTKSLLAQTKKRILENNEFDSKRKIITHPEMYIETDTSIISILTQERLLRLLQQFPKLSFDIVVIDEAHNILDKQSRSVLLATAIIILNTRKANVNFKFLTPFLLDHNNLKLDYTDIKILPHRINEEIKSELLYFYDFTVSDPLKLYDQYLDDVVNFRYTFKNETDLLTKMSSSKNIVYFNKPKDIEVYCDELLMNLEKLNIPSLNEACRSIEEYVHSDYKLCKCIKHGIIYHHGSVPDNIRLFIEDLYSSEKEIKYLITSSTLLEGVNIPANRLFIFDHRKGKTSLTYSQFRNLIGRVCRFGDIFNDIDKNNLKKLMPEIYLLKTKFSHSRSNIEKYIKNTMKINKDQNEFTENILLQSTKIDDKNSKDKRAADIFLKNQSPESISSSNLPTAKTSIGISCFKNNIIEFDIIKCEDMLQYKISLLKDTDIKLSNSKDLIAAIASIFIPFITDEQNYNNLKRLENTEAQNFYSMFLSWRVKQATYKEMISSFLTHWDKIISSKMDTLVFVGKWGDQTRNGFLENWTDINTKSDTEKVNLAIVRIKEEQDFLDYNILKFVEVLNEMELINSDFYLLVKYCTNNLSIITMIKSGLNFHTAKLLWDNYLSFLTIDNENQILIISPSIVPALENDNINKITIHEISYHIR